jgi:hypothetical protein
MEHSGSSVERAGRYRQAAIRLRDMAEREQPGRIQRDRLNVAQQYDDLAASVSWRPLRTDSL